MSALLQALSALAAALPCFAMAWKLAQVWKAPFSVEDGRWVRLGVGIWILEFVLAHSGVAMAALAAPGDGLGSKLASFGLLAGFYFLFAGTIALAFRSVTLLWTFGGVMAGRLVGVVIGMSEGDASFLSGQSVAAVCLYSLLALVTVFVGLPKLGMKGERVQARLEGAGTGLWIEQPHLPIGAGTIYFALLGLINVFVLSWIDLR